MSENSLAPPSELYDSESNVTVPGEYKVETPPSKPSSNFSSRCKDGFEFAPLIFGAAGNENHDEDEGDLAVAAGCCFAAEDAPKDPNQEGAGSGAGGGVTCEDFCISVAAVLAACCAATN